MIPVLPDKDIAFNLVLYYIERRGDYISTDLLFNKLLNDMEQRITNGTYLEGEKLPSERKLSDQFNISRNIVRQVLITLKEKGFIEIKPSKGAYVTAYNDDKFKESLERILGKYNGTIQDILETREVLEYVVIHRAVKRRTEKDIENLITTCEKMDGEIELTKFLEWDLEFHKLLAEATQNKILSTMVKSFYDLTDYFPFQVTKYNESYLNIIKKAQNEHWELIEALKHQDMDFASTTIKGHMASFRKELEYFVGKNNNDKREEA